MLIDKKHLISMLSAEKLTIINDNIFAQSAVLIPLIESKSGQWEMLFQVRAPHLQRQPGEICFPGGILDSPQESPRQAARRETNEELGIKPEDIYIWGQLGLLISLFNMLVYSFVGQIPSRQYLDPNPDEVASIFTVPLRRLLELKPKHHYVYLKAAPAQDFPFDKIPGGRDYPWRTGVAEEVFYEVDGKVIWGLTARILQHFLALIK